MDSFLKSSYLIIRYEKSKIINPVKSWKKELTDWFHINLYKKDVKITAKIK